MQRIIDRIKTNKIKCKKCGDIIESTSVHDFKWCSCETIFEFIDVKYKNIE